MSYILYIIIQNKKINYKYMKTKKNSLESAERHYNKSDLETANSNRWTLKQKFWTEPWFSFENPRQDGISTRSVTDEKTEEVGSLSKQGPFNSICNNCWPF